jgi:hypothetical protein
VADSNTEAGQFRALINTAAMCCVRRVAHVVDVLATSHAAQLAAAAAANLLSSMLLPWDSALAVQLCPQQLRHQLLAKQQQQQQRGAGAVQFKVQAALREPEDLLLQLQQQHRQQQECCSRACCVRYGECCSCVLLYCLGLYMSTSFAGSIGDAISSCWDSL